MLSSIWMWIIGSLATIWLFCKSLIFYRIRLNNYQSSSLFDIIYKKNRKFIIEEEVFTGRLPRIYKGFCFVNKIPLYFNIQERLLRAGWQGTDIVSYISTVRIYHNKLKKLVLEFRKEENTINIYILQPWDAEKIGNLNCASNNQLLYVNRKISDTIEKDIIKVLEKRLEKASIILYGKPGNGKSFLIRHLATKYKLPIYIVSFIKNMNNHQLIRMFSNIKSPSIILFENFDSYFNKRKCEIPDMEISFDNILNNLDGTSSTNIGRIFFITANDIEKIDYSLRRRPARFKHVFEIGDPSFNVRQLILGKGDNGNKHLKHTVG